MTNLHIARTAVITLREGDEASDPGIVLDRNDPLALLPHLRSGVELEMGLTAAGLVRALRPWSEILSKMAWIDFDAWDKAIAKPPLRVVEASNEKPFEGEASSGTEGTEGAGGPAAGRTLFDAAQKPEPPLAAIVIAPVLHMARRRRGASDVQISWQTSGLYGTPHIHQDLGIEDLYRSISFSSPAEWAHLPLILSKNCWTSEMDLAGSQATLDGAPMLSPDLQSKRNTPSNLKTYPSFFDAIVLGFLDDISCFGDPDDIAETRDEVMQILKDALQSHEDGTALVSTVADSGVSIGAGTHRTHKVISL